MGNGGRKQSGGEFRALKEKRRQMEFSAARALSQGKKRKDQSCQGGRSVPKDFDILNCLSLTGMMTHGEGGGHGRRRKERVTTMTEKGIPVIVQRINKKCRKNGNVSPP